MVLDCEKVANIAFSRKGIGPTEAHQLAKVLKKSLTSEKAQSSSIFDCEEGVMSGHCSETDEEEVAVSPKCLSE